jgi:hypothetical protein
MISIVLVLKILLKLYWTREKLVMFYFFSLTGSADNQKGDKHTKARSASNLKPG